MNTMEGQCLDCHAPICGDCYKHLRFYRGRIPNAALNVHGENPEVCVCEDLKPAVRKELGLSSLE